MAGYTVLVDDNFHYMDASERYTLGTFATSEEAVAACRTLVDLWLGDHHEAGMSAEDLFARYTDFGEDPFVMGPPGVDRIVFSAWTYAKERAHLLCADPQPKG